MCSDSIPHLSTAQYLRLQTLLAVIMFAKNRIGFMPGLFVAFLEELSPDEKKDLIAMKSEQERVNFVLNHPFICDKFNNITGLDGKNNAKAVKAREEGNVAFQAGNFKAALLKYSTAVCQADPADKSSCELSLALANRSAALQRLKQYTRGVEDIESSLSNGYPLDKQFKLLERKGQMLSELQRYEEARTCFNKAKKLVHNSALNEVKIDKFISDMDKLLGKIENKTDRTSMTPGSDKKNNHSILEIRTPHPKYQSLDASVDIKYTKDQGRFAVANMDIPAGEQKVFRYYNVFRCDKE